MNIDLDPLRKLCGAWKLATEAVLRGRNSGREWPGTAVVTSTTFRYNPPTKDKIRRDYRIQGKGDVPLFLYGVPNHDKARRNRGGSPR